jgi:hypothetical protein
VNNHDVGVLLVLIVGPKLHWCITGRGDEIPEIKHRARRRVNGIRALSKFRAKQLSPFFDLRLDSHRVSGMQIIFVFMLLIEENFHGEESQQEKYFLHEKYQSKALLWRTASEYGARANHHSAESRTERTTTPS